MIELDTLNRLLAIEYNYEQLLRLHECLIHEHEELKQHYKYLETDYDCMVAEVQRLEDTYENRTGRRVETGQVTPLGGQDH